MTLNPNPNHGRMRIFAACLITTMIGASSSSAATLGVWNYDGFMTEEENEGSAAHTASVSMNAHGEEVTLTLSCNVPSQSIAMSMGGREKFEQAAQTAITAAKGQIDPDVSYLNLIIDDQAFEMKSMIFDINGELGFIDDMPANGNIVAAFLEGSSAALSGSGLQVSIPLKNSANAICETLKQCGVSQTYCQSTGR